jgi:hypothetical protein
MTAEACREWRESLGAYVLGQLPADEQAATRAHVDGCEACRSEVEWLMPLAELLPLADPSRLGTAHLPPAELGDRIASRIGREGKVRRVRRRRRFEFAFGAVAATATAAVLLALVVLGGGGSASNSQQVSFRSLPRGVAIAATLQPRPFGTQIRMDVSGIRSGTLCQVFLRRANGSRVPAGSFRYRYGAGRDAAVLTSALDLSAARAVGVRAGNRTFTAPLRHGVGAEAASNPKTTEKEYS